MSFSESRKQQQQHQQQQNHRGNRYHRSHFRYQAHYQYGEESSNGIGDVVAEDQKTTERLFMELNENLKNRFRRCAVLEAQLMTRSNEIKEQEKTLAEEKKLVAAWKKEAAALQAKNEADLRELRSEKEQLERASTDFAVQLAELKRMQREMEKKKTFPPRESSETTVPTLELAVRRVLAPEAAAQKVLAPEATEQGAIVPIKDEVLDEVPLAKRMKLKHEAKRKEESSVLVIQAALQEDAPGLFEILEERGLLEGMDIITNVWDAEADPGSSQSDDFRDLTAIVGKLWGTPSQLLLKENRSRIHATNSSKHNYCLPCLVSLIEQTKILRQRKWPVRWGWCRPLNAFLFVFEKHNRIVVERPEYGFATYFFELVQSVPVKWQVERLIKVMSCVCNYRAALLENRPLEASKDLLPEEARVLENYGWTPNTGIGSLLNFCDRVVHDCKTEDEAGEWKSKIGRMLMDGHDHGSIVLKLPHADNRIVVKQEIEDAFPIAMKMEA